MIESVHFQNFKSLRDVELTGLQRLTVIVGPSGVGKTSVLQGLRLPANSSSSFWGHMSPAVGRLITRGAEQLLIRVQETECTVRVTADRGAESSESSLVVEAGEGPHMVGHSALLKFEAHHLGAPSEASPQPHMFSNGEGLATLLAYYAGAERETLSAIEAELREVIGNTGRIRTFPDEMTVERDEAIRIDDQVISRARTHKVAAHRFELEIDELGSIPGDLLSEGTLITLGLLALLHQSDCPSLILLDDIDVGLHPDAQAKLIAALRKLLARRPDLQILCTSHSPYLLDHFAPEEVQVLSLHDGQVAAARLDQHEDWPKWEGKLQTGEFWQSVGESWVKPAPVSEVAADAE